MLSPKDTFANRGQFAQACPQTLIFIYQSFTRFNLQPVRVRGLR
jgi:hypothetical protein